MALGTSLFDLDNAYNKFFKEKIGYPNYKKKYEKIINDKIIKKYEKKYKKISKKTS